jgi:preprotein translocase subunit SecD
MSHRFRILASVIVSGVAALSTGCTTIPDADASIFEIRAASIDPIDGWTKSDRVIGGTPVWISPDIVVDASGIQTAEPILEDQDRNAVLIDLDDAATGTLLEFTTGWLSRPVAVFVDGQIVTTPILNTPLSRKFIFAGKKMTKEQAKDLARRLRESD